MAQITPPGRLAANFSDTLLQLMLPEGSGAECLPSPGGGSSLPLPLPTQGIAGASEEPRRDPTPDLHWRTRGQAGASLGRRGMSRHPAPCPQPPLRASATPDTVPSLKGPGQWPSCPAEEGRHLENAKQRACRKDRLSQSKPVPDCPSPPPGLSSSHLSN